MNIYKLYKAISDGGKADEYLNRAVSLDSSLILKRIQLELVNTHEAIEISQQ